MPRLLAFVAAFAASIGLYVVVFSWVHRPLTIGDVPRQLAYKLSYAKTLSAPRVFIFAGSSGRYSHRCEALTLATGRPCANLSIAVGIGLDFMFDQIEPVLRAGDLLYLPLEYGQYPVSKAEMDSGTQNFVLVHDLPGQLWQMAPGRIARAYANFDLPFLVHGLLEMGLAHTGFQRRTSLDSLTPQGDERGHTEAAGAPYRTYLQSLPLKAQPLPAQSHALSVIGGFLDRARERGVLVIAGLPTTPQGSVLDTDGIERLRLFFESHGHRLLVLPNRSQYPLSCFFDTLSHLNEPCQIAHSKLVGTALAAWLQTARTGTALP